MTDSCVYLRFTYYASLHFFPPFGEKDYHMLKREVLQDQSIICSFIESYCIISTNVPRASESFSGQILEH